MNDVLALLSALEKALGPIGAVFAAACAILYWDIRGINKDLRESIPERAAADVLLSTAVNRMASAVEMLVNKK